MKLKFINEILILTLALAVIGLIIGSLYQGFYDGLGIFLGGCWGGMNLLLIRYLTENLLISPEKHFLKLICLVGLKFPLLYGFGYILLSFSVLPLYSLLIGFFILLLAIFIICAYHQMKCLNQDRV